MLKHIEDTLISGKKEFSAQDITYCLCIRISEITPWILKRLEFCVSFYDPAPKIVVVDFGSEPEYAAKIKQVCDKKENIKYVYEDDKGVFALAKARNIAVQNVETEFFLLSDIDFVFDQKIFGKLAEDATNLKMDIYPKRFLTMPISHLDRPKSEEFMNSSNKQSYLAELNYFITKAEYGKEIEFYTTYSNVFFMHKTLFSLLGGYCDEFRGHGSEDFDLMLRLGMVCSDIPKSNFINKDFYGPSKDSYWGHKDYSGFRRYIEAVVFNCETLGYKAYHLWHLKPRAEGYWTNNNDWKREKFNIILDHYINNEENLLEVDYLPKEKLCLCLMNDYKNWFYFLPFKAMGYKLKVLSRNNPDSLVEGYKLVANGEVDRICMFNPYMKSHRKYLDLFNFAKKNGVETTVIERGGLPNSIYYADEVSYGDRDFYSEISISEILNKRVNAKDTSAIKAFKNSIRSGDFSLENMDDYKTTSEDSQIQLLNYRKSVFIPLQLSDDMAVNYFTEGFTSYPTYMENIKETIQKNPDILFVIKPHPLNKVEKEIESSNVIWLKNHNIHAVIDGCTVVLTYNSGVGLLALAHQKPVYTIGNAYYSLNGKLTKQINNINELVEDINRNTLFVAKEDNVINFYYWLLTTKYSWFSAKDVIREFKERKSHAYDNINVDVFNFKGIRKYVGLNPMFNYSKKSYVNVRMDIDIELSKPKENKVTKKPEVNAGARFDKQQNHISIPNSKQIESNNKEKQGLARKKVDTVFNLIMNERKMRKLKTDPVLFVKDFVKKYL